MKVAFATCSAMPDGFPDDRPTAALLEADFRVWDDESVDWNAYDRVVLRSVWDYSWRLWDFLAWCDGVGDRALRNSPAVVSFNCDKRYLGEIDAPAVPTRYVAPRDPLPEIVGEVVVKPNISAGARDTGRFRSVADAVGLVEHIHASGRTALVQPYLSAVENRGEISVVFIGGEISHVLHKRAVLRGEGVAPVAAESELRVAAAMLEPDLVTRGVATASQTALAVEVHGRIGARFGTPLYARVDLVEGFDGQPLVSELELIEPNLHMATSPGAAERLAAAVRAS